jgi:hypothetical protein
VLVGHLPWEQPLHGGPTRGSLGLIHQDLSVTKPLARSYAAFDSDTPLSQSRGVEKGGFDPFISLFF